jgi:UDP:flavonoid glycosyltransferase YjiC (YdhE family)
VRALFTVQPSVGHLHPLVPVARALSEAGHDVAVCSSASFRPEVEAFGLTHLRAGLDWLMSDQSTWAAFPPLPPPGPEFAKFAVTTLADITTGRIVPDLMAIAREWRPDLIVREGMEYGGCLAAERLGLPHASVAGNAYAALDSPDVHYFPGNRRMVAEPMARHREELGLPPDPETLMPFRHLHLCFTPPAWDGASAPRPPNIRFLRHTSTVSAGARLPEWVERLPDRPTVLASLGTVFNKTPGVLEAIVAALAEEPVNLIVAIGNGPGLQGRDDGAARARQDGRAARSAP